MKFYCVLLMLEMLSDKWNTPIILNQRELRCVQVQQLGCQRQHQQEHQHQHLRLLELQFQLR